MTRLRLLVVAVFVGLMVGVLATSVGPTPPATAANGIEAFELATPGPLGPISVIGDSVLVGAAIEPSLPANLAAAGWGPIRFRAGLGYTAGNFQPAGSQFSVVNWIRTWRAQGGIPSTWW
ncbi:MAG: hypothetical protein R2713_24150 [Ilumatobacteraceae bacterium]